MSSARPVLLDCCLEAVRDGLQVALLISTIITTVFKCRVLIEYLSVKYSYYVNLNIFMLLPATL